MSLSRILPILLLATWIAAFGVAALGTSPLAFDDHPGQLYRAWLVATRGFTPWVWNDGWWAGYPEMQFYPPGFAYAAAALHHGSLRALGVDAAYHALVWLAYAAPGLTTYLLLARLLGGGWAALPGAFVALTLSAGLASGVEGGVHIGMVAARLAWAALPLLLSVVTRTPGQLHRVAPAAIVVVAAIVLTHPAHAPAAVLAVALAGLADADRGRGLRRALWIVGCAAALTAFWTLPLVARIGETRALAWGDLGGLLGSLARQPLVVLSVALAIVASRRATTAAEHVVTRLPWILAAVVAIAALVLDPLGLAWLPADRLVDSVALAIVLSAGLTVGRAVNAFARSDLAPRAAAAALAAIAVAIVLSLAADALTLWPKRGAWPSLAATERGLRLPELWARLEEVPPGRVLFTRSGVPLVYGTEWWRPHTHVTALAPRFTTRAIVHGTFTHPSPIAALVYRGDAGRAPIRALAETRDGHALFGRELATLDAPTFDRYAERLGISAVVALDDDAAALRFVEDNPRFRRSPAPTPFRLYTRAAVALPAPAGDGRWELATHGQPAGWTAAHLAYYPLWSAWDGETRLETRRGAHGDLEVRVRRAGAPVTLRYAPGLAEIAGVVVSAVAAAAWAVALVATLKRRGRQSAAV
ncbi:MAG: hypothetical protein HYR51_16570 [Candidatus Rokubacteria bacterium]|nr:hypothetical protein [Candidatus Rokubacteria bacterium]